MKSRLNRFILAISAAFALVFLLLLPASRAFARQEKVNVYVFWGDGCPHCAEAMPWLEEQAAADPRINLVMYEVWNNTANREYLFAMGDKFGFEPTSVPTIFIGDQYAVGFNDTTKTQLLSMIASNIAAGFPDAADGVPAGDIVQSGHTATPQATPEPAPTSVPVDTKVLTIPILGAVDLSNQSVWISTLLISFVDGFNPCSLWVLSMLLALTVHSGSRKRVLWIGIVFLTVTAAIYALFIVGLFSFLTITSFAGWIRVLVALVALFFALVNIKDYFWYKEGLSLTIKEEDRKGIISRMRRVMNAGQSFWGLTGATVVLAAGVSLVEFSCTAGFPVLWTNLITTAHGVTPALFVLLLLLYMLIYQADELVIFLSAVFTLKANRMEEKHGRILKLAGGMLMLTLAGVMLINPNLMNKLSSSLIIFGIALAAAALVLLLHRVILPKMGIRIGTEEKPVKPKHQRAS